MATSPHDQPSSQLSDSDPHRLGKFIHQLDFIKDETLDQVEAVRTCPLEFGHTVQVPRQNLGAFLRLRLEPLQPILSQIDLHTLRIFRRLNRQALRVVDSIPESKILATYAPNALRGIQSIGADRWNTCTSLYKAFCTAECELCGDFGGYLYVRTCKRVCFLCFTQDFTLHPLTCDLACKMFRTSYQVVKTLPHVGSVPGVYQNGCAHRKAYWLVDFRSA
ncbi:hypothetical protein HDK64DRAFT_262983 [Phyllosticta capitalensis]